MENATANLSVSVESGCETQEDSGIMSYRTREIYQIVNFVILSSLIGLFGICSNIINIIIFFKHRFHESMNVSLLGLSISDLCGVLALEWFNMCTNPLVLDTGLPIHPMGFQYATGGWPHVTFTRVTCIITVFIAIERCLCITAPLKVKRILTPKRALLVVLGIYLVSCSNTHTYGLEIGQKLPEIVSRNFIVLLPVMKS
ncbi:chemosensory receptor B [Elysia marginata]|uniref:Chemosensory receptor B n=1 Tax=Elysia marginata TaxID=1093978 RepID=A0AAV4F1V0_9GAST|nr:chemosensory receptor B [Elysia marginata]